MDADKVHVKTAKLLKKMQPSKTLVKKVVKSKVMAKKSLQYGCDEALNVSWVQRLSKLRIIKPPFEVS